MSTSVRLRKHHKLYFDSFLNYYYEKKKSLYFQNPSNYSRNGQNWNILFRMTETDHRPSIDPNRHGDFYWTNRMMIQLWPLFIIRKIDNGEMREMLRVQTMSHQASYGLFSREIFTFRDQTLQFQLFFLWFPYSPSKQLISFKLKWKLGNNVLSLILCFYFRHIEI